MTTKYITKLIILMLLSAIPLSAKNKSIQNAGDIIQVLVPLSAYASTYYMDDKEGRNQFYKSFLSTVLITHTLKLTVNETRPDGTDDNSFPSGHTSAAFQGAAFIHHRYGLRNAIIPYIAATFVGYSRIDSDKHYLHDVVAGAIIGIYSDKYFTTRYKDIQIKPISYLNDNINMYGINIIF